MRSIWFRISLGALAVFVVGFVGVHLVRRATHEVRSTLESDAPISLPLVGFVPFRLDSAELGSLRKLQFLRSSPSEISGVKVVVELKGEGVDQARFANCRVGMTSLDNLDEHSSFTCVSSDSGLQQFGYVFISGQQDSMPLFLPTDAVTEIRGMRLGFAKGGDTAGHRGEVAVELISEDSVRALVAVELERAATELRRAREAAAASRAAAAGAPVQPPPPSAPPAPSP